MHSGESTGGGGGGVLTPGGPGTPVALSGAPLLVTEQLRLLDGSLALGPLVGSGASVGIRVPKSGFGPSVGQRGPQSVCGALGTSWLSVGIWGLKCLC